MANAKNDNRAYEKLRDALKSGDAGRCYVFHGEEQYLLADSLAKLRSLLCPNGLDGFGYKRFDANSFSAQVLEEATEMLPFLSDKTLIEVHDCEFYKGDEDERNRLCTVLADLPSHTCVIFVFSAIVYKPDNRLKTTKEILKHIDIVDFAVQEPERLVRWISKHFSDAGKSIGEADAVYLAQITGGLMTSLHSEIEKVAAYAKDERVSRGDIDAVVMPVLDAVTYKLTDAIVKRDNKGALAILDKLLQMREEPHKLIYSISIKMRQLLAARVCLDNKISKQEFMKLCSIYSDYPAQVLLSTARETTPTYCRSAVLACAAVAKELNSMSDPEARIIELVLKLLG